MGINLKYVDQKQKGKSPGIKDVFNSIDLNKEINLPFLQNKFGDKKKEKFFSSMGILLSSGLDINTTFKIVIEQEEKDVDKQVYLKIYQSLVKGMTLNDAVDSSGKFSYYDSFCIKMGEESGKLSDVLVELSSFYTRKIRYKRKFINAMTYPLLVLTTAVGAVIFMLNFLVPMFIDVFQRTNTELPGLTKFVIKMSNLTSKNLPVTLLLIILIIVLFFINRKKEKLRDILSKIVLKLPIFGDIIKLVYIERFLLSMVLLTKAKISVLKSISLTKNMIGFYPLEIALKNIENKILHGRSLNESMAGFQIFDRKIISMIKVGEEVNQLESIFEKLNKQYSEDLDYKINNLGNLLEPLLIVFVGLFVAIILISMYLPIFQIGTFIK